VDSLQAPDRRVNVLSAVSAVNSPSALKKSLSGDSEEDYLASSRQKAPDNDLTPASTVASNPDPISEAPLTFDSLTPYQRFLALLPPIH
jgi:hypothetical protein